MSPLKIGDRVKVAQREMTAADYKTGLFYDYFCKLTGTIERIYEDKTVCVRVEMDSLPEDVRKRHLEVQEAVKKRWMSGLSQEQRDKLSEADKAVKLGYNILIGEPDVEVIGKSKSTPATKSVPAAASPRAEKPKPPDIIAPAPSSPQPKKAAVTKADTSDQTKRPTQADIEKAEEEYLKAIAAGKKDVQPPKK